MKIREYINRMNGGRKIIYLMVIIFIIIMIDMSRLPEKQVSAKALLFGIGMYRKYISPKIGGFVRCKFEPTCSMYGYYSIKWYGAFWGGLKTMNRLMRCSPFSKSHGYDPP